jgi:hypothetical protein
MEEFMMNNLQKLLTQEALPVLVLGRQAKTKPRAGKKLQNSVCKISEQERRQLIATSAYFRAQSRNFSLGNEESDWLAAESEVNEMLHKNVLE